MAAEIQVPWKWKAKEKYFFSLCDWQELQITQSISKNIGFYFYCVNMTDAND